MKTKAQCKDIATFFGERIMFFTIVYQDSNAVCKATTQIIDIRYILANHESSGNDHIH